MAAPFDPALTPAVRRVRIPAAVLYAAKSTEDEHGSIPTQLADCREMVEREGWHSDSEFHEEAASAYTGNRGPQLAAAITHAKSLAAERGTAILLAQHSDRFARGDGRTARHLGELYFELRRVGVEMRSVQDDSTFTNPMLAVAMGERAHEDSARKAKATAAGMRRAAERGEWPGGILADGYRVIRDADERGKVIRRVEFDPERRPIFDLIWEMARRGDSAVAIATELNRRGCRTRPLKRGHRPGPFDANRIRQTLDNGFYAGLSIHRGEVVGNGHWPRYIKPEEFHRLRDQRRARGNTGRRRGPGRPPEGYVLARIAVCGECGSPIDTVTGRHVRKDGTRPRRYVCRTHRERPEDCAAKPIDAALVDPSVVENVPSILGNVDGIRASVAAARNAERTRLKADAGEAQDEIEGLDAGMERMRRRITDLYAANEQDKAEGVEDALAEARTRRRAAEARRDAGLDALNAVQDAPQVDEDAFWIRLRDELAARIDGARGDTKRLNIALGDFLEAVELTAVEGGIRVRPTLSEQAAWRIWRDLEAWPHALEEITDPPQRLWDIGPAVEKGQDPDEHPETWFTIPEPPAWEVNPQKPAQGFENTRVGFELGAPLTVPLTGARGPSRSAAMDRAVSGLARGREGLRRADSGRASRDLRRPRHRSRERRADRRPDHRGVGYALAADPR
jgi:DNA invertase Pin-like site-specific DNA recombinase